MKTTELTNYESQVLIPLMMVTLNSRVGKSQSITNKKLCKDFKIIANIDEPRVRFLINHIRTNGLVRNLIAGKKGYWVAETDVEASNYIGSLIARASAILDVAKSMHEQL